jgi:hypothetical protein
MADSIVVERLKRLVREFSIAAFDLLQTNNVRFRNPKPILEISKAAVDSVDIKRRDFQLPGDPVDSRISRRRPAHAMGHTLPSRCTAFRCGARYFIGRSVVRLPLSRAALIWLFRMVGGYVVDHSDGPSAWSASQSIARTAASL